MYLGIELGSTRIKAVMIDGGGNIIATGSHTWENKFENGYWTYDLQDVWAGLADAVKDMPRREEVQGLGISAMMHGYLAFDSAWNLLTPFRTWRNDNTRVAAERLSRELGMNIPLRWSCAHLYQAVLDNEPHLRDVKHCATLAGYVHRTLTGENVLGVGDASGMFPIEGMEYHPDRSKIFEKLSGYAPGDIFPAILPAGMQAGRLNEYGAGLLGIPVGTALCPPEGDAGTGMVSTGATEPGTGNVSAGTSIFAMLVLEQPLSQPHHGVDIVATPWGHPVAMIHVNECTAKIDPRIRMFGEAFSLFGEEIPPDELFTKLYEAALGTGELAQCMRQLLDNAVAPLADGVKDLIARERLEITQIMGHGGFFKSGRAGQVVLQDALGVPVTLLPTGAEGGAHGMAMLASYVGGAKC